MIRALIRWSVILVVVIRAISTKFATVEK